MLDRSHENSDESKKSSPLFCVKAVSCFQLLPNFIKSANTEQAQICK